MQIQTLKRFAAAEDGNFALMMSILVLPLAVTVGVALDYSTASTTRSKLQNATDAAVLAVAREGSKLNDQMLMEDIVRKSLAVNLGGKPATFTLRREGVKIVLDTEMDAGTNFDRLLGGKDWTVAAQSISETHVLSFEIGFVLDTTGSMRGGKLQAMKDAVNGMVESMSAQVEEDGKLKFTVIPFSTLVNVGPQHGPSFDQQMHQINGTGAQWLDLRGESEVPQSEMTPGASRFQIFRNMDQKWAGCVEARYADGKDYDIDDTPPNPADPSTLFIPSLAPDEPKGSANDYLNSDAVPYDNSPLARKERWAKYGVKADSQGYPLYNGQLQWLQELIDELNKLLKDAGLGGLDLGFLAPGGPGGPGGSAGGKGSTPQPIQINDATSSYWGAPKGPNIGCSTQPILPLTSNYQQIKTMVNSLQADGNTNITEGVTWGVRALSPGEPFTEGAPYTTPGVRKVLIVLTDGANTLGPRSGPYGSHYSAYGFLNDERIDAASTRPAISAAMNERSLAACEVAKKAGIDVYTIRLEEPDVATGTMLKECASNPDKYFDIPNRSQLDDAFKAIRDTVTTVRLAY